MRRGRRLVTFYDSVLDLFLIFLVLEGVESHTLLRGGLKSVEVFRTNEENAVASAGRRFLSSSDGGACPSRVYNGKSVEGYKEQGFWKWKPTAGKFLVMRCAYGRVSNRIKCFRNALTFAGFFNRTLIVTVERSEVDGKFDRHVTFDIDHVRQCYGDDVIMTSAEYMQKLGHAVVVDQIYCYSEKGCEIKNASEPYRHPQWETIKFEPNLKPQIWSGPNALFLTVKEVEEIMKNVTGNVLYMGDFYHNHIRTVTDGPRDAPFERSSACSSMLAVQPHRAILETGRLYVENVLKNEPFMGVHLRRGDFKSWCSEPLNGCYRPLEQVIFCLWEKLKMYNISTMFLATNARSEELDAIFKKLNKSSKKAVHIVQLRLEEGATWTRPLHAANLNGTELVLATMEKVICSLSSVFVGTFKSTFTVDIERMRYGLSTANCRDSMLCDNVVLP